MNAPLKNRVRITEHAQTIRGLISVAVQRGGKANTAMKVCSNMDNKFLTYV